MPANSPRGTIKTDAAAKKSMGNLEFFTVFSFFWGNQWEWRGIRWGALCQQDRNARRVWAKKKRKSGEWCQITRASPSPASQKTNESENDKIKLSLYDIHVLRNSCKCQLLSPVISGKNGRISAFPHPLRRFQNGGRRGYRLH